MIADLQRRLAEYERKPATSRMQGARRAKRDAIDRELLLVAILTHLWPAHLAPPSKPQRAFSHVLHIETPAGRLCYRLTEDELPLFDHLSTWTKPDPTPQDDKIAVLSVLSKGWN